MELVRRLTGKDAEKAMGIMHGQDICKCLEFVLGFDKYIGDWLRCRYTAEILLKHGYKLCYRLDKVEPIVDLFTEV